MITARGVRPLLAAVAFITLAGACSTGTGGSSLSTAPQPLPPGVPTRFVPADSTKSLPASGCLSPLKDPQSGTTIIMVRADNGVGDYLAPSGAFHIPDGKVLRLECSTGEVLGLVRR
jgi:hypothetical protein